ncbi:hypothetical protein [Hydrogenophaga intermedia]|uniref:Uncharacterized protein n=1 Tax=Hydrogenophaga intermedia TaxID=65786 RepID=A0A1L1PDA6_HYDIT|nr:hypothetical protein [Hydrogenophaga intermedia]TMU72433.1 hypothetical protein FGJ01_18845 [Hydrogenophaga intermedia]CDN87490.1 hypothetical protein BN948_01912 [Hydrogenophaga intermedia]
MTPTTRDQAAQAFALCAGLDPEGVETPEGAAAAGECFELCTACGRLFLSVSFVDGVGWIHAAAGQGQGMTAEGLHAVECQALARGCRLVGFQTVRRGLVRRAKKHGYRITRTVGAGFVLVKAIKP